MNVTGQLAYQVRARRKALGLSLDRLAAQAEISKTWLWEIERAKGVAGIVVVARLADILGCSIDALVYGCARFPPNETPPGTE
jgi:transcriptional regulator with XRE-family HTH domain